MRIGIIIIALGFLFSLELIGQPVNKYIGDVVQPSPNEASLGKYGDIPVSHYTGIPSISIPIHTLAQGSLSDQVSLNYHAGGIRVEEIASRVGLGWSLSAGGHVTRVVQGLKDDDANKGYYYNGGQLDQLSSSEQYSLVQGTLDGEPDLFTFSCGGYSGKFYFNKNKEAVLLPQQDIKISATLSGGFESFLIITPEGNRHHFGKYGSHLAYDQLYASSQSLPYRNTWHLLRSETYDRLHYLTYTYEQDAYSYTSTSSCRAYSSACSSAIGTSGSWGTSCPGTTYTVGGNTFYYNTTNIVGYRLTGISSQSETVNFVSQTSRDDLGISNHTTTNKNRLDRIEISSGTGTTYCKKFDLAYNYFTDAVVYNSNNNIKAAKRLKLESVTERGCTGSLVKAPYTFTYNTSKSLPWRHSRQRDHWGYANGRASNENVFVNVPSTEIFLPGGGSIVYGSALRDTREAFMKAGVIETITYPTGGVTTFDLEANRYTTDVDNDNLQLQFSNCTTPSAATCCGTPDIATQTLTLGSTLSNPRLLLGLTPISIPGICGYNNIGLHLTIKKNGVNVFSEGYNYTFTQNYLYHQELFTPTSSPSLPTLSAGTYTFVLEVTGGRGDVQLYNRGTERKDVLVGGLRLHTLTSHDGIDASKNIIKTFEYKKSSNGESSGKLLYEPHYGRYISGLTYQVTGGASTFALAQSAIWSTTSFVPMSSHDGNHLGYQRVVEYQNGNGKIVHEYGSERSYSTYSGVYPEPPVPLKTSNGRLKKKLTYKENQNTTPLQEEVNDRSSFTGYEPSIGGIYRVSEALQCGLNGASELYFINQYAPFTELYNVGRRTRKLEGVTKVEDITYNTSFDHFSPERITTTESNGANYHTFHTYPQSLSGSINTSLKNLNIVAPIKTEIKHGSNPATADLIDGTETLYANFTTANGTFPYPQEYKRYEANYSASGAYQSGSWVSQAIINGYDTATGQPDEITIDGWNSETYEWYNTGLLKKRTFEDFETTYDYHTGTRLLSKITNVDNTSSTYTYDKLFRLKTAKDDCRNVTTTLDYNYGTPATGGNYVSSMTDYVSVANSALDLITNKQFFDGLGRPIQSIKVKQGPTSTRDVIIATAYDNQGRVKYQYEPLQSAINNNGDFYTGSLGDYSTTTYEASPLNRPISQTHTAWNHPTTTTYGSNTATINGYTIGDLFKQTIIDADSKESITYTDTRGRTIATQMAGSGGSAPLTTLYKYDPKDRPTKIIPPDASLTTADLIFTYEYYGNDLVKFKKLPDQDQIEYRYNKRDLMTHYQDGYLKGLGEWMAYNYDDYGHQIKSGYISTPLSNNNTANPSINLVDRLSQSDYYGVTTQHKDKVEKYFWRELLPTGAFGNHRQSVNTYDVCGRLKTQFSSTLLSQNDTDTNDDKHTFSYDAADNLLEDIHHQESLSAIDITYTNTIDHAGRPLLSKVNFGGIAGTQTISERKYNEKGLLHTHGIGHSGSGFLQTAIYIYKSNQWLESMSSGLFDYDMIYNATTVTAGLPQKNGNIAEIQWQVSGGDEMAIGYRYDNYNRLTHSYSKNITDNISNQYRTQYQYDKRGNFSQIRRYGLFPSNGALTLGQYDILNIDPVSGSNKINTVTDIANADKKRFGVKGSANSFIYDNDGTNKGNGNLTYDPTAGATMTYNHLNLPYKVVFDKGGTIEFTYDNQGNQLRKVVKQGSSILEDRYYIGPAEYKDGQLVQLMHDEGRIARAKPCDQNQYIGGVINSASTHNGDNIISNSLVIPTGTTAYKATESVILNEEFEVTSGKVYEAHITPCSPGIWQQEYVLRDHLGSTRVVFDDKGDILQEHHTYPYGLPLTGDWQNSTKQDYNYLYNGKEQHKDFDWQTSNYGARFLNQKLANWNSIDPLAEKTPQFSPYNYVGSNPISYIDPNGMSRDVFGNVTFNGYAGVDSDGTFSGNTNKEEKGTKKKENDKDAAAVPVLPFIWGILKATAAAVTAETAVVTGVAVVGTAIIMETADNVSDIVENTTVYPTNYEVEDNEDQYITLYRGVGIDKQGMHGLAMMGTAIPLGIDGGHSDPVKHNTGDNWSIFTSWTTSKAVANRFASKAGPGGVIMTKTFKLSETIPSPDYFHQAEVLIPGIVRGANATILK